ncbi:hypothetical protein BTURTLESOX_420 [bacterium endosymbiont of Bathymodiolus sp. 5 South]|nr:hypothetical protein BTURTLESOX_420 [bacterium endosymbiont of Bathymodiolus sp. 5 South]
MYGYSEGFYIRPEVVIGHLAHPGGFDINTISIILGFKIRGFEG